MPLTALLAGTLLLPAVTPITPQVFAPGEISTNEFESHAEFTLDGKTLYIVKSTPQFTDWKIYESRLIDGHWSKPAMAFFSGKFLDADPFITLDGKRFFFISNRPAPGKTDESMDVWYMDRVGNGWSAPIRPGNEVNSETDEWFPTVQKDGTLYFGSARTGGLGNCDIWSAKPVGKGYAMCTNLGPAINTDSDDIEPFISPDGKVLIFNSRRPGGLGGLDFYVSTRLSGGWSKPFHLPSPINSRAAELSPKLSRDGKYFYYTGVKRETLGDIYFVSSVALGI
jgi:hypothetical protein